MIMKNRGSRLFSVILIMTVMVLVLSGWGGSQTQASNSNTGNTGSSNQSDPVNTDPVNTDPSSQEPALSQ